MIAAILRALKVRLAVDPAGGAELYDGDTHAGYLAKLEIDEDAGVSFG